MRKILVKIRCLFSSSSISSILKECEETGLQVIKVKNPQDVIFQIPEKCNYGKPQK